MSPKDGGARHPAGGGADRGGALLRRRRRQPVARPGTRTARLVARHRLALTGVDPCLLGTWRVNSNQVYGLIDDVRVLYTGGAGTVISYRADGTFQPTTTR